MRVLVAVDRDAVGAATLSAVVGWVAESGVDVTLLHVIHPREIQETPQPSKFAHAMNPAGIIAGHATRASGPPRLLAEDRIQVITRLKEERHQFLRDLLRQHLPGSHHTTVVEVSGAVAHAIIEVAATVDADLVAMGTHGRGRLGQALLGSVAEHVVRESRVPVLVIGPGMHHGTRSRV